MSGEVVMITGASQGIGRAMAASFAANRAKLLLIDRKPLTYSTDSLLDMGSPQVKFVDVDLGSRLDSLPDLIVEYAEEMGGLDVAIANAAVEISEPFLGAKFYDVLSIVNTTQLGVFFTCQGAARAMENWGVRDGSWHGRIIIVGSIMAEIPEAGCAAYCMAKAGVHQLARVLALELAPWVTVNVIAPGHTDTPGEREMFSDEQLSESASRVPARRLARADEIADAAIYLASPAASYVTGTTLTVDGGASLHHWLRR